MNGAPMIRGLNHLTLAVRDLDRARVFYRDVLGLAEAKSWPDGAYLTAGPLWLCLSRDPEAPRGPAPGYTHFAFDVAAADFEAIAARIRASGAVIWKENRSEGDSLYFLDPEGHKLELHVGTLESRLAQMAAGGPGACR